MAIQPVSQFQATPVSSRMELQAQIVKSTVEVDISAANKPLELLYRSALDKLNAYLEPVSGSDAIQKAAQSGMDFSPEAVAERIVSFATGYFGAYAERHADATQETQLSGFMDLVGGAIEQGFNEAREILDGLGVWQGEIADNADRTMQLIQERLGLFEEHTRSGFDSA